MVQNATECYIMLHNVTECYRTTWFVTSKCYISIRFFRLQMLQDVTECKQYMLQNVTECYRMLQHLTGCHVMYLRLRTMLYGYDCDCVPQRTQNNVASRVPAH